MMYGKTKRSGEEVSALSRRDVTWTVEARAEVVRSGGHRMPSGNEEGTTF